MSGILNIPPPDRNPEPEPERHRGFAPERAIPERTIEPATQLPATSPGDEDAALLARVQNGNEQAMAVIYDRYAKIVYSVALRVLRDPASAEDILQEILL